MEFKFRAVDNRPTPTPTLTSTSTSTCYPPPPLSTFTFLSERSLLGGFSSMVPRPNPFLMNNASEALRRELEKEQIRREIIAAEIVRRRELEEEVRREMALEREWELALQRNLASQGRGFPFDERVAMMRLNPVVEDRVAFNLFPVPQPQQLMAPPEIKPSLGSNEDKVIMLAKPDPDLFCVKRKAATSLAVDGSKHSPFNLKKKQKEEWSCALCQVSATSERVLNEHLQGRRHRAKAAALRNQKIGESTNTSLSLKKKIKRSLEKSTEAIITTTSAMDTKTDSKSLQPGITGGDIDQTRVDDGVVESKNEEQLVQKSQNIEGLKNKKGTATGQEAERINALKSRSKFWCEICQVGASSQIVMEGHKKGRKHLRRMKKSSKKYECALPTSSAALESPELIKDTDAINKDTDAINKETDRNITHAPNKETIIKIEESFADSEKASPVAESCGDRAREGQ